MEHNSIVDVWVSLNSKQMIAFSDHFLTFVLHISCGLLVDDFLITCMSVSSSYGHLGCQETRGHGCLVKSYFDIYYACQLSRLHALRVSLTPAGWKLRSQAGSRLAVQSLTPDWKMWVAALLLDTISKNRLTQTHLRNEIHV